MKYEPLGRTYIEPHIESQNGTARPVTALYIHWRLMQNIRRLSL